MKTLLFANTDWYLYNFRLRLAQAIRSQGHELVLLSPPGEYVARLREAGLRWVPFSFSRQGLNPLAEAATLLRLAALYRRERPDLVHHFTIKCVLYGSIAARLAGVKGVANSVIGLGHLFTDERWRTRLIRQGIRAAYRVALRGTQVIFQNPDDRREFSEMGLVGRGEQHLIRGSGVDIARFHPVTRQAGSRAGRVLFASRLLWSKGVREYVEAAARVREAFPSVELLIAGRSDPGNPDALSERDLEELQARQCVRFLGHRDDMDRLIETVDIVALPSYYREGTPRILVEAAAAGLPLVAADVPGSREIVRHGVNGLLVPPRDARALAQAICTLLADAPLRAELGARSRQIACEEFSEASVIDRTLDVYRRALA